MRKLYLLPLAAVMAMASCIQDEPMNTECDIQQVSLHLETPTEMF